MKVLHHGIFVPVVNPMQHWEPATWPAAKLKAIAVVKLARVRRSVVNVLNYGVVL
jgi:hypothetical protein